MSGNIIAGAKTLLSQSEMERWIIVNPNYVKNRRLAFFTYSLSSFSFGGVGRIATATFYSLAHRFEFSQTYHHSTFNKIYVA